MARKQELALEAYESLVDPRPLVWSTYRTDMRIRLVRAIREHEHDRGRGRT
jgi:hypothetical protein